MNNQIPFNWPYMTGKELEYISKAHAQGKLAGDGPFTVKCQEWIEEKTGCQKALLTHSCTAALEMAALLLDINPGDEVIIPSYTFVSTANAFALRGAVPVFVDIRDDTLNIDERLIDEAITERTKAIVPVHYAGVACEMDKIMEIANRHKLVVIEDAAQGVMASYDDKPLGVIGHIGAFSFHETKNVISGEGGAILISSQDLVARAEVIREKGTDRSRFFRGEVDKYTWQDIGSSFLPGELTAAFLFAQLEEAEMITTERLKIWSNYHKLLEPLEGEGRLRRPSIPDRCVHNGHMYYVVLAPEIERKSVLANLQGKNIWAVSHYVPLHSSPAGRRFGRVAGKMTVTDHAGESLVRLPLWVGLTESAQEKIVHALLSVISS